MSSLGSALVLALVWALRLARVRARRALARVRAPRALARARGTVLVAVLTGQASLGGTRLDAVAASLGALGMVQPLGVAALPLWGRPTLVVVAQA